MKTNRSMISRDTDKGAASRRADRTARPLFVAAGLLYAPCLAVVGKSWDLPLYPTFVALLVTTILVSSARSLLASRQSREASVVRAPTRARGAALAEFARTALDPSAVTRAIADLPAALVSAVGIDGAAVFLKARHDSTMELASSAGEVGDPVPPASAPTAVVAEGAGSYGNARTRIPLVADGAELGCVVLGHADQRASLEEADRSLAALLCGLLALALRNAELRSQLGEAESRRSSAEAEIAAVPEEIRRPENFRDIVGASPALHRVLSLVERTAPSDVAILVTGETGTGKELIARAVHALSPRRDGPLVTVNCPAIPGPLAESELFGHERGAFTDAVAARPGQFELANGGTIFLDEVADLPLDIQAKLLRVLQEREARPVGGHKARPIDVRTIAATNRDLLALVREGRFREDLYYRLAAVEVCLPPLRDRHGDTAILASYFLQQAAQAYGKSVAGFSPQALSLLCDHRWPGNIRQLQNVVQRAVLLCTGDAVRVADLSEVTQVAEEKPPSFGDAMRQEKRRRFLDALQRVGGNQSAAARLLGMSRSNFARMLRSLEISVPKREGRAAARLHQYPSSTKLT